MPHSFTMSEDVDLLLSLDMQLQYSTVLKVLFFPLRLIYRLYLSLFKHIYDLSCIPQNIALTHHTCLSVYLQYTE